MKRKFLRILGVGLTVIVLASLIGPVAPVTGSPADNVWEEFKVPSTTSDVLAPPTVTSGLPASGYISGPIAQAIDGALWAYNNHDPSGVLFKSTDGGHKWSKKTSHTTVIGAIVDIATSPIDADTIYIATATEVRQSIDGGTTFTTKVALPGETITSIDVGELGGNQLVLIGTTSGGSYTGNVYLFNEASYPSSLTNMMVGNIDVLDVALSPNFVSDHGVFVVGLSSPTVLQIMNKVGAAAWGSNLATATATASSTTMASIAFPNDFDALVSGMANWYIGYNGAGTDEGVYLVQGFSGTTPIVRLSADVEVASLAVSGVTGSATNILVGLTNAEITFSNNGGATWMSDLATGLKKQPTGTTDAMVVMDSNFDANGTAWVATSGVNGAISRTINGFISWNQVGLINATITNINDVSVIDGVVFIATDNGTAGALDSIWRNASSWERVFHSSLAGGGLDLVEQSPSYTTDSSVFVGEIGGKAIWQSTSGGEIWTKQRTDLEANTTAWIIISPTELIVGTDTGTVQYTYRTTNNGLTWIRSGSELYGAPYSISRKTSTLYMMGTSSGYPYYSTTSGETWTVLASSLGTNLSVHYGSKMWAASASGGVYRRDTSFARIDSIDPASDTVAAATGLVFGSDGTLYATDSSAAGEGIGRSLSGTTNGGNLGSLLSATTYPYFERVNGTATGTLTKTVTGLWIDGDKLWTVYDGKKLYTYVDGLSGQIADVTATLTQQTTATVEWGALSGATMYTVQINTREDFLGTNVGGTPTTTQLNTVPMTGLTSGTNYYVRVRGTSPIRTLYSDIFSFTTALGQPSGSADWVAPTPGAMNVSLNPIFTWGQTTGATGYEFQLTDDVTFYATPSLLLENATTTVNTYIGLPLAYSTTYYWRVRATGTGTESGWTNGIFTTMDETEEAEQLVITPPGETVIKIVEIPVTTIIEQPIPSYLLVTVIIIGAVLIVALIILIVRTRRIA